MPLFTPFAFVKQEAAAVGPTYVTSGLLGYWDANDSTSYPGSGTTWYDLSPNGYDLTINGSPSFTEGTPNYWTMGSSKYMSIAQTALSELTENDEYTIFAAAYITNFTFNNIVSNNRTNTGGFRLKAQAFGGATGNRFSWQPWDNNDNAYNAYADASYGSTNTWYVVGLTHDWVAANGPVTMQVNGGTAATTNTSTAKPTYTTANFYVGGDPGNSLTGRIAMAMVYNRKLTSDEMTQNFDYFASTYSY